MHENSEMQVRSLGWKDHMEEGLQPTQVFLPGKSPGQRSLLGCSPWGSQRVRHGLAIEHALIHTHTHTHTHTHISFVSLYEMATHSSILAWRIPGMGEPGGLPSVGSHRVRHN